MAALRWGRIVSLCDYSRDSLRLLAAIFVPTFQAFQTNWGTADWWTGVQLDIKNPNNSKHLGGGAPPCNNHTKYIGTLIATSKNHANRGVVVPCVVPGTLMLVGELPAI